MTRVSLKATVFVAATVTGACGGGNIPPPGGETAPGADRTAKTAALESGR